MFKEQFTRNMESLMCTPAGFIPMTHWKVQIYSETNRIQEAYQAYEELLFVDYQMVNAALQGLSFNMVLIL